MKNRHDCYTSGPPEAALSLVLSAQRDSATASATAPHGPMSASLLPSLTRNTPAVVARITRTLAGGGRVRLPSRGVAGGRAASGARRGTRFKFPVSTLLVPASTLSGGQDTDREPRRNSTNSVQSDVRTQFLDRLEERWERHVDVFGTFDSRLPIGDESGDRQCHDQSVVASTVHRRASE